MLRMVGSVDLQSDGSILSFTWEMKLYAASKPYISSIVSKIWYVFIFLHKRNNLYFITEELFLLLYRKIFPRSLKYVMFIFYKYPVY